MLEKSKEKKTMDVEVIGMKKTIVSIIVAIFILTSSFILVVDDKPIIPDRTKVMCTCGCNSRAVDRVCPAAIQKLKEFDAKIKQVKGV